MLQKPIAAPRTSGGYILLCHDGQEQPLQQTTIHLDVTRIQEEKIAVVMVSHDIESAVIDASHILHLQEKMLFFGSAEDYRKSRVGRNFLSGTEHGQADGNGGVDNA